MSHLALTAEAKAAIKANLELELKTRQDRLVAMCEAQVAGLQSRLERRVNRIPSSKRNMRLIDLLDASIPAPSKAPAKKEAAAAPAPVPVRAPAPAARKTRAAPAKPAPKPASKTTRGKKRPSDDGDKENEELDVPKKRVKAAPKAAAAPATRSTRAASRKVAPQPQVLSPKPNNSRPPTTRIRRQR